MAADKIHAQFLLSRRGFTLDINLEIPSSGLTVLFGHSGSGKTTLLRCIAGLDRTEKGFLSLKGDTWQDKDRFVPAYKRPIGYIFQEACLFDHLTAIGNLNFALKRQDIRGNGVLLERAVELLGIESILHRYPAQLSGGEKQRIAIARGLLINPRILLMDEPLASLDQNRKRDILPYLESLKEELDLPIIYVTHSPDEVARLADHLVALENGQVVAQGSLAETFNSLDFPIRLGEEAGAVLHAVVAERDERWHLARVNFPGGNLWFRDNGHPVGQNIRIRVLAKDISLSLVEVGNTSIVNALPASIVEVADDEHPGLSLVKLKIGSGNSGGSILIARVTRRSAHNLALSEGMPVWAHIKSVAIID